MVISQAAHRRQPLRVIDIRRAFFYAPAQELIYIEIPSEDFQPGDADKVGRLNMSSYGTRSAARNWKIKISQTMKTLGFIMGTADSCLFYHPVNHDTPSNVEGLLCLILAYRL